MCMSQAIVVMLTNEVLPIRVNYYRISKNAQSEITYF